MSSIRVRYLTVEFPSFDIHLCTLRDRQEFDDPDGVAEAIGISSAQWSHFGVVWPGGWALAQEMLAIELQGQSFLEIGCGIALASLVLNHRGANITALDYHPVAGEFLARNASLNEDPAIPFLQADWTVTGHAIPRFDVIIASDVLYEDEHARGIAAFVATHLKPEGKVVVADPGRGHRGRFRRLMSDHGFGCERHLSGGVQIMEFRRVAA